MNLGVFLHPSGRGESWEKFSVLLLLGHLIAVQGIKSAGTWFPIFWYRINPGVLPTQHSFYSLNTATETTIVFLQIGPVNPRSQFLQIQQVEQLGKRFLQVLVFHVVIA